MNDKRFDNLLASIRNESLDEKNVAQAGERVWKSIAGTPAVDLESHTLRSCADFQQLIDPYLSQQLKPARALLFEDHVHACVACRKALQLARDGETQRVWTMERKSSFPAWRWGLGAATLALGVFLGFAFTNGMIPGQHPVRATVQSADGALYDVSGTQLRLVPAGYEIKDGDEIRTAKNSSAMVRLQDGSLVEMGERSGLSQGR